MYKKVLSVLAKKECAQDNFLSEPDFMETQRTEMAELVMHRPVRNKEKVDQAIDNLSDCVETQFAQNY